MSRRYDHRAARRAERHEDRLIARNMRVQDQNVSSYYKDLDAADRERQAAQEKYETRIAKAHADADKAVAEVERRGAMAERQILGAPRTAYKGATFADQGGLIVMHWKAVLPAAPRTRLGWGAGGLEQGPVLVLMPLTDSEPVRFAPDVLAAEVPGLGSDPAFAEWRETVAGLVGEVARRYPILEKLRDDEWWLAVCEAAGVTISVSGPETVPGTYGPVERKTTLVSVPSITGVSVTMDGLELTVAHRPGDPAEKWSKAVPALRAAFKTLNVAADNLEAREDSAGNIVLAFDDAPSNFPRAIAPEPPSAVVESVAEALRRYQTAEWVMGVDARGNTLTYPMSDYPHAFVVGGTGGGKSVWTRTQIELLRTGYTDPRTGADAGGGWRLFIASGKPSDFAGLEGLPGVQFVATDTAQLVVMLHNVKTEMDRRNALAAQAKREGRGGSAFDFPPMCVVLDEFGYLGMGIKDKYGAKGLDWFRRLVDSLLRVARESRIHVVLSTQTVRKEQSDPASIPGSWQANISLAVALGNPDDPETIKNAFPPSTRDRAALVGPRLIGHKGRGLVGDERSKRVIEFQSLYGWSPGTTSLAPEADPRVAPPTEEVRDAWQRWEPISASVPWLAPRLGIKVASPAWSVGELSSVSKTPVVVLTDRDGAVKPGMERCDHLGPDWLGAPKVDMKAAASLDFDDEEVSVSSTPQSALDDFEDTHDTADQGGGTVVQLRPRTPEATDAAEPQLAAEEREEIRRLAELAGFAVRDAEPPEPPETPPEPPKSRSGGSPRSTRKPKMEGNF